MSTFSDAFMATGKHLGEVPMAILSIQGLTNGIGFFAFRLIRNAVQLPITDMTKGLPAAPYIRGAIDGLWDLALFSYGTRASM